ncbi:PA2169 family four-helix-bundle protein [Flavobacteriaceae bacterium TP-CH-4]|uniref:PA2169 family four-helix-bundle protein n=1 Tax=Pelagihabitans pacificus TaxID=2696054 RepID=A0A967AV92_9FLAO|nr:PA2169 family four-helix-bundle protein [Pelagihabitans pacificus]NHF61019.1 PA2169 family four-helix-bundle protein [Pelagihabitans pacificus]
MSTYTETVSNKLNDLLEKTYDAEKGFKQAAENVENAALKDFFERKSSERYNFGHELKEEIRAFGQEVDKGDSLTSKAHRAWMDLKSFFSSDNAEAMLEEAMRGEKAAIEEYNDVLSETTLPPSTSQLLTRQRDTIQEGLAVISNLEHAS